MPKTLDKKLENYNNSSHTLLSISVRLIDGVKVGSNYTKVNPALTWAFGNTRAITTMPLISLIPEDKTQLEENLNTIKKIVEAQELEINKIEKQIAFLEQKILVKKKKRL